jgi:hypothetical protein
MADDHDTGPPAGPGGAYSLPPHAAEVMAILGPDGVDTPDSLMWRTTGGATHLYLLCSDTFAPATADCEPLEPEDMPLLRQTLTDLARNRDECFLAELFVARKRGASPMSAWMEARRDGMTLFTAGLFSAAGKTGG